MVSFITPESNAPELDVVGPRSSKGGDSMATSRSACLTTTSAFVDVFGECLGEVKPVRDKRLSWFSILRTGFEVSDFCDEAEDAEGIPEEWEIERAPKTGRANTVAIEPCRGFLPFVLSWRSAGRSNAFPKKVDTFEGILNLPVSLFLCPFPLFVGGV